MPRRLFKTLSRQRQRWKQRWFMRPFRLLLEHPAYWSLNRRSVIRAFSLGLFISFVPLPITSMTWPVAVRGTWSAILAIPKSVILTRPSGVISRLPGLMSR